MYIHYEKQICSRYREHEVKSYEIVQLSKHAPEAKEWLKKNKD